MKTASTAKKAAAPKVKRKVGRPKLGAGVTVVSVSMEKNLLKNLNRHAKDNGVSRSQVISESLRSLLGA